MAVLLMATRGTPLPRLRMLRIGALMTQEQLAAKARMSRNTVARIENDGKPAELSTVRKLADALGVTAAELMRAD
ncbi:MAG TPA: helix-turn-helix transcriptional regulator [Chloroflexota bacterium]|nr:helix-turn-helix transcriptional regulator [Chloroflexota bacterium]